MCQKLGCKCSSCLWYKRFNIFGKICYNIFVMSLLGLFIYIHLLVVENSIYTTYYYHTICSSGFPYISVVVLIMMGINIFISWFLCASRSRYQTIYDSDGDSIGYLK